MTCQHTRKRFRHVPIIWRHGVMLPNALCSVLSRWPLKELLLSSNLIWIWHIILILSAQGFKKRPAIYFPQIKNKPELRKPSKIEIHSGSIHFKVFVTHFYLLPSFSLRAPIPDTKPSSPALLMKNMQISCHTQVTMSISASIWGRNILLSFCKSCKYVSR